MSRQIEQLTSDQSLSFKGEFAVQVVQDLGRRLMRFIRVRVSSEADAEDVMQDVWQQLATSLEAGPVEQVGAWLFTVARNRIIDKNEILSDEP